MYLVLNCTKYYTRGINNSPFNFEVSHYFAVSNLGLIECLVEKIEPMLMKKAIKSSYTYFVMSVYQCMYAFFGEF